MRLITREASKFGVTGWLTYDAVFCWNQEGSTFLWNYTDSSQHQVYIANRNECVAAPCANCHKIDHATSDCTVSVIRPKMWQTEQGFTASREGEQQWKGKQPALYSRSLTPRLNSLSWNAGSCRFLKSCIYAHYVPVAVECIRCQHAVMFVG